jgi:hypothetical protein
MKNKTLIWLMIFLPFLWGCEGGLLQEHGKLVLTQDKYSRPLYCERGHAYQIYSLYDLKVKLIPDIDDSGESQDLIDITRGERVRPEKYEFSTSEMSVAQRIKTQGIVGNYSLYLKADDTENSLSPLPVLVIKTKHRAGVAEMKRSRGDYSILESFIGTRQMWWGLLAILLLSLAFLAALRYAPQILAKVFKMKWFKKEEESKSYTNIEAKKNPKWMKSIVGSKGVIGATRLRFLVVIFKWTLRFLAAGSASLLLLIFYGMTKSILFNFFAWIDYTRLDLATRYPTLTHNREWIGAIAVAIIFVIIFSVFKKMVDRYTHKITVKIPSNAAAMVLVNGRRYKGLVLWEGELKDADVPVWVTVGYVTELDYKYIRIELKGEVNTQGGPGSGGHTEIYGDVIFYSKVGDLNKNTNYQKKNPNAGSGSDAIPGLAGGDLLSKLYWKAINRVISNATFDDVDDFPSYIGRRIWLELLFSKDEGGNYHFSFKDKRKPRSKKAGEVARERLRAEYLDPNKTKALLENQVSSTTVEHGFMQHIPTGIDVGQVVCPGFTADKKIREATQEALLEGLRGKAKAEKVKKFLDKFKRTEAFKKLDPEQQYEFAMISLGYVKKEIADKRFSVELNKTLKELIADLDPDQKSVILGIFAGNAAAQGGQGGSQRRRRPGNGGGGNS